MTNPTTPPGAPISLPDPWDYAYEWDSPLGILRSFDYQPHNGVKPDRHVSLFTEEQMRAAVLSDRAHRAASPDVAKMVEALRDAEDAAYEAYTYEHRARHQRRVWEGNQSWEMFRAGWKGALGAAATQAPIALSIKKSERESLSPEAVAVLQSAAEGMSRLDTSPNCGICGHQHLIGTPCPQARAAVGVAPLPEITDRSWVGQGQRSALLSKFIEWQEAPVGDASRPFAEAIDEHLDTMLRDYARAALSAQTPGEGWQHVAYAEDGELHWMSGRKFQNCELYAPPLPKPPATPSKD